MATALSPASTASVIPMPGATYANGVLCVYSGTNQVACTPPLDDTGQSPIMPSVSVGEEGLCVGATTNGGQNLEPVCTGRLIEALGLDEYQIGFDPDNPDQGVCLQSNKGSVCTGPFMELVPVEASYDPVNGVCVQQRGTVVPLPTPVCTGPVTQEMLDTVESMTYDAETHVLCVGAPSATRGVFGERMCTPPIDNPIDDPGQAPSVTYAPETGVCVQTGIGSSRCSGPIVPPDPEEVDVVDPACDAWRQLIGSACPVHTAEDFVQQQALGGPAAQAGVGTAMASGTVGEVTSSQDDPTPGDGRVPTDWFVAGSRDGVESTDGGAGKVAVGDLRGGGSEGETWPSVNGYYISHWTCKDRTPKGFIRGINALFGPNNRRMSNTKKFYIWHQYHVASPRTRDRLGWVASKIEGAYKSDVDDLFKWDPRTWQYYQEGGHQITLGFSWNGFSVTSPWTIGGGAWAGGEGNYEGNRSTSFWWDRDPDNRPRETVQESMWAVRRGVKPWWRFTCAVLFYD